MNNKIRIRNQRPDQLTIQDDIVIKSIKWEWTLDSADGELGLFNRDLVLVSDFAGSVFDFAALADDCLDDVVFFAIFDDGSFVQVTPWTAVYLVCVDVVPCNSEEQGAPVDQDGPVHGRWRVVCASVLREAKDWNHECCEGDGQGTGKISEFAQVPRSWFEETTCVGDS